MVVEFISSGAELSSGVELWHYSISGRRRDARTFSTGSGSSSFCIEELSEATPVVSVLGIRRIGKTSLLKVLLSELSGLYVDMRGVARRSDLEAKLTESMESSLTRLRRFLEGIRGVRITGLFIQI